MKAEMLRFGIVGIGGRPQAFLDAFALSGRAVLAAVCDCNKEAMEKAMAELPEVQQYTDYEEMLEKADLDAVIIGTPMPLHVPQSLLALERDIHVFSEVTAAISLEECRQLADACKKSRATYMLGENCCYMRHCMTVRNMVRAGLLGEVSYAEGEYNHDCRKLIPLTPWRKTWLYDVAGVTYGTHSLGPILSWFEGDRVTEVCCAGAGQTMSTLAGEPLLQRDSYVMLCKTAKGRLIKIKNNLSTPRPYGLNYLLEGSLGAYQNCKPTGDLLWLEGRSQDGVWEEMAKYEADYIPELWRKYADQNDKAGHLGADVVTMIDFIDALWEGRPSPIDVHAALDMTLPGLISQQSVLEGGKWLPVPDSREW